MNLNNLDL
jgi:lysophospholipase